MSHFKLSRSIALPSRSFAHKIVAFGREPSGFSEYRLNKTGELALHRYKVGAIGR